MKSKTILSKHAMVRNHQRTSMHEKEIVRLLGEGRVVNTGSKPGLTKNHLLFYSKTDDACFVAIQDQVDGKIVTILPLDYQRNLAWKITEEQQVEAKRLAVGMPDTDDDGNTKAIIIKAHYYDGYSNSQKTRTICKKPSVFCDGELHKVVKDESIVAEVERILEEKALSLKNVFAISARLGENGNPVFRDL
jgi:hypothetical protein